MALSRTEIHGPYWAVGNLRWNCHRTIGVSPGLVILLTANSFTESRTIPEMTRVGCWRSTARLKFATSWSLWPTRDIGRAVSEVPSGHKAAWCDPAQATS